MAHTRAWVVIINLHINTRYPDDDDDLTMTMCMSHLG